MIISGNQVLIIKIQNMFLALYITENVYRYGILYMDPMRTKR